MLTDIDGFELGAAMLREIHAHYCNRQEGIDDDELVNLWRKDDGAVLRRYLEAVKRDGNPMVERAFLAVLTDFIGAAMDGVVGEPERYEQSASVAQG